MSRAFLTARWTNLFLATYAVPEELLKSRLPPGLELDLRDGQAFVSLVAFDFVDTRVLGIPWPGYRNFPELNLRFYVKHGNERGVVFIREYVGKRLVAWIARGIYNEPYRVAPMTSVVTEDSETITVEHRLTAAGRTNVLRVTGSKPAYCPEPSSVEHFFKEHHWWFNTDRRGRLVRYRVDHPVWEVYPVRDYLVDLDWASVYGPEWHFLQGVQPLSTILAAGSAIKVYPKALHDEVLLC
jgi:uncharacterized protein YqjF (DUF2071 family)